MSTKHVRAPAARAADVKFTDDALVVWLQDGRIPSVHLARFPRLREAPVEPRSNPGSCLATGSVSTGLHLTNASWMQACSYCRTESPVRQRGKASDGRIR